MSQHLATATLDGHPVEIVAGFDRGLGDYGSQRQVASSVCPSNAKRARSRLQPPC